MNTVMFEFTWNMASSRMDFPDAGYFNPYRQMPEWQAKARPTHYTTEGGGTYSARPDLSRPGGAGIYYAAGGVAAAGALIATTEAITKSYGSVIQNESEQEQQSLWQGFSQALTGGFGIGSGLNL